MSQSTLPEFYKLSEKKEEGLVTTALIYGGSGCGKTFYAGSAGDRTLFVNIGDGIKTLHSPAFKKLVGANPICVDITEKINGSGIAIAAEAFDMVSDVIDHALATMSDAFDTIVVDDATALRKFALNKGLEVNQTTGKSKSLESSKKFEVIMTAVQDFGIEMNLIEQFVASYTSICKQAGKNFILTAHERLVYTKQLDDKGKPVIGAAPVLDKVYPGFTGQTFPQQIPIYFDWVFHAEVVAGGPNGSVFRMRTVGDDLYTAKCRDGGVFGSLEINPNFLRMQEKVRKAYNI